jgi:hypothetical protein
MFLNNTGLWLWVPARAALGRDDVEFVARRDDVEIEARA